MKLVLSLCLALLLVPSGQAVNSTVSPPKPTPRLGMTMGQVLAQYGRPRHAAPVNGQTVWYYRLKFDEVYGRAMVPFEFSSDNVRLGEIAFDKQGRIVHIVWNHGGPAIWVIR